MLSVTGDGGLSARPVRDTEAATADGGALSWEKGMGSIETISRTMETVSRWNSSWRPARSELSSRHEAEGG